MSDNKERAGVELYLDVAKYIRDVDAAIGKAGEFEAAWKAAMGSISDATVKVNVEASDVSAVRQSLDDLAQSNPNIHIVTDDGELNAALDVINDIDAAAPTVPVDADDTELDTAKGKVDDLDGESVTLPFDVVDGELDTAKRKIEDIDGETVSVEVQAETSNADNALEAIQGQLNELKSLAVIDLVMNASGPALGVLQQALDLVTSTDEAVRTLAARTGEEIPNAGQIIDDLYTANWGESKQQIAEVLALSSQLGVAQEDLAAATESAFQVASVTGGDVNEILRTQNSLVKNGLAPSYQAAADLLTTGFQSGADRGDDLLDTFNEYGSTFRQLGLDGAQALDIINSGLAAGFDNSDRVADVLREVGIRVTDLNDTAAQDALKTLGLPSPAEGEQIGADFLNQILTGIQNAAPEDQTILTRSLFGTLSEDFGLQTILGLENADPINATFDLIEGRATQASTTINDTLKGSLDSLFRTVEVEAQAFLSSDQINLDQKINDIKNGITSTLDALKGGEGLADAIEIGFNIPGFADSVHRFEASIGEFAIGVLELIAGVQDFLGKDSSGTRGQIAQLAGNQLAFNLKVANPDEISGEIQRAADRGVTPETITESIGTAITELANEGAIAQAQTLRDSVQSSQLAVNEDLQGIYRSRADRVLAEYQQGLLSLADIQPLIDAGDLIEFGNIDTSQFQDEIDVATKAAQAQFDAAVQSGDFSLAKSIAEDLGNSGELFNQAFNDAIASGDFDLAESIANQSGEINPAAVIVVDAFREQAKAARRAAFEELGGFEDAGAEGGAAGKRDFVTTTSAPIDPAALDQMKAGKDLADLLGQTTTAVSQSVVSDSNAMAAAFEDADARIASAATDNTMTASFEAVRDVAMQTMPEMSDVFTTAAGVIIAKEIEFTNYTNILKGALLGLLGEVGPGLINLATNLANISANASSAAGATSALFAAQGAGAGGGNTVTVNNNYNVNSVATGVATGQAVATSLRSQ